MEKTNAIPADAMVLTEAALAGGRAVLAVYATEFDVDIKGDDTPVSQADRDAEAVIISHLQAAFPDIPIVAEESASEGRIPDCGDRFFLVDPLDGTKEFIKRNGEFTVNIGLIEHGVPVAGVVHAPALGRICIGWHGEAWAGRADDASTGIETLEPIRTRPCSGT